LQAGGQRFDPAHLHHLRVDVTADWEKLKSLRAMVQTSRASVFDKVKREYPKRFDARH
jgi:hypothetical protein